MRVLRKENSYSDLKVPNIRYGCNFSSWLSSILVIWIAIVQMNLFVYIWTSWAEFISLVNFWLDSDRHLRQNCSDSWKSYFSRTHTHRSLLFSSPFAAHPFNGFTHISPYPMKSIWGRWRAVWETISALRIDITCLLWNILMTVETAQQHLCLSLPLSFFKTGLC